MVATFVPHLRLSLIGDLPNGEMFDCSLSLAPEGSDVQAALEWVGRLGNPAESIAANNFGDLVTDCSAFWARGDSRISSRAVLKRIKLAPIGANGHYTGPAFEAAVNVPGSAGPNQGAPDMFPHQIARKITLETDGDLGRVKGGFYLPGVTSQDYDPTTDLMSAAQTAVVRASVTQFIDAVNNAPGLDATGSYRVVIASQGRHRNGVQVAPPTNWAVKRVNVGRRLDVQRRRANKIGEARITDAVVA